MTSSVSDRSARSRRGFLLAGAGAVAVGAAAAWPPGVGRAHAAGSTDGAPDPRPVDDRLGVDVRDHGAVGDGRSDDTEAFASAIEAARVVRGRVLVPAGTYVVDSITVPLLVALEGTGADVSSYGA